MSPAHRLCRQALLGAALTAGCGSNVGDRPTGNAARPDGGLASDGVPDAAGGGDDDTGSGSSADGAVAASPGDSGAIDSNGGSGGDAAVSIPITPECPTPTGTAVTLSQSASGVVIANGLVTLTIGNSGQVTQLTTGSQNLMGPGDSMYVSESGGSTYYSINASSHAVVEQTADTVEVSFVDTSGGNHDMDWDLHYVVRRGVSGFYYFLITQVGTTTHPNPATLSELRTVQRFDSSTLVNGYSGERHGLLPTNAQLAAATTVQNATYLLTTAPESLPTVPSLPGVVGQDYDEGPVYTKYDWASYRTEDLVHGVYGGGFGVWLLSPSWEFYTGGPLKQELMVQDSALVLNMYHGGHAGSAITTPSPAHWQKIYGPNLVYVNAGTSDEVISDALAQGAKERSEWPYCWMNNPVYPLAASRGTVTGTLAEAHGQAVAGAMVTLAQAGALIDQGYDYMFWSQADASGRFTVPEVVPGTYSVHVYATQGTIVDDTTAGFGGEIVGTVTVAAGANDVGTLTWSPPYHAKLLWSIGESDQRSGEFRFDPNTSAGESNIASATGRMYGPSAADGVWTIPPASTTYTIGTSTPADAWYFVQSVDGTWTVDFNVATVPAGGAFLTIALAGAAHDPHLNVFVNGHQVVNQDLGNDQTLYRSCLQGGLYQVLTASVPAADLAVGSNTATFNMNTKGTAGAGVYYDIVKLESD
jgi:rhamnogalacturonan endolyase